MKPINVFNEAPRFFQEQLCRLAGVFANLKSCQDTTNCTPDAADNSWGWKRSGDIDMLSRVYRYFPRPSCRRHQPRLRAI
jgi:hypothetical protein